MRKIVWYEKQTNQLRWLVLSILVIVLDQLSKWCVSHYLVLGQPIKILPVFNVIYMQNTGAAFSFLKHAGGWQRWLFMLIAIVISGVILRVLYRLSRRENWTAGALALILGGAIGNLYDRAVLGHVIDFVSLHINSWYFATFNIADSAITVGVILWLLTSLRKA